MEQIIKRISNLESMRKICMLLLVGDHYVVRGGFMYQTDNAFMPMLKWIIAVGKTCLMAFLAVGYRVLSVKPLKVSTLQRHGSGAFYSVCLAAIVAMIGRPFTPADCFSVFFPITDNSHGFTSTYLARYLFITFMQRAISNATRFQLLFLIVIISEAFPIKNIGQQMDLLRIYLCCLILNSEYRRIGPLVVLFVNMNVDETGVLNIIGNIEPMMFLNVSTQNGIRLSMLSYSLHSEYGSNTITASPTRRYDTIYSVWRYAY